MANKKITLVTGEYPPYTTERNLEKDKIVEKIVKEAFATQNIDVEILYMPWARAYSEVEQGNIHGTFPWAKTEERLQSNVIYGEESVIQTSEVFFNLKSSKFEWGELPDLKNYNIGGVMGYNHVEDMKKAGVEVDVVRKMELNFRKLLSGRIDAFPEAKIVGYTIMKKSFDSDDFNMITHHEKPLSVSHLYMLISKSIPNFQRLSNQFDDGLKKIKETGRYDLIIKSALE